MRMNDAIGRTALAVAIGCIALVVVTVGVLAMPAARSRLGLAPSKTPAYTVGGRIDVPASVYEATPLTVVIFARDTCAACQRSQVLFAKATADLAAEPSVHVVMMTTAPNRSGDLDYARAIGLDEHRLIPLDATHLRLKLVPTLVLVDRYGEVRYSHEGVPSPADIHELVRIATSFSQRR